MTERPTNTQPEKHQAIAHAPEKQAPAPVEKKDEKTETKTSKKEIKPFVKKEEAVAHGDALRASLKHSMYISRFIKHKKIDDALDDLQEVVMLRAVVPFKGEIPHRSAPGIMSGRYPQAAAREFIRTLKNLKGNAIANGLELDRTVIYYASASWAFRPMRRGGRKAKRVNVILKAREMQEKKTHG